MTSIYDQPTDPGPIPSVDDGADRAAKTRAADIARLEHHLSSAHDYARLLIDPASVAPSRWRAVEALLRAAGTVVAEELDDVAEIRVARWAGETADAAASGDYGRAETMVQSLLLALTDVGRV